MIVIVERVEGGEAVGLKKPVVRETAEGFMVGNIRYLTFGEAVKYLAEYTFIPIPRENEPLR